MAIKKKYYFTQISAVFLFFLTAYLFTKTVKHYSWEYDLKMVHIMIVLWMATYGVLVWIWGRTLVALGVLSKEEAKNYPFSKPWELIKQKEKHIESSMVTSDEVIHKIEDYIGNRISRKDVADWALKIVISKEDSKIYKSDRLLSDAIHALFDLHHEDGSEFNPTIEELKAYRDKLKTR